MLTDLPVVDSCQDCGACCLTQCAPPGYIPIIQGVNWRVEEDVKRVANLTEEQKAPIVDRIKRLAVRLLTGEETCCWFDPKTKSCKHYDSRPSICREFEVGSDACLGWRKFFKIDGIEHTPEYWVDK